MGLILQNYPKSIVEMKMLQESLALLCAISQFCFPFMCSRSTNKSSLKMGFFATFFVNELYMSTPCFVLFSQTMTPLSTLGWSILKTLTICLHIVPSLATGPSSYTHSESRPWMVHTFNMLLTKPTYQTSTFMHIKMLVSCMALVHIIAKTTIFFYFLLHLESIGRHINSV